MNQNPKRHFVAYDPIINRHLTVDDLIERDAQGGLQRLWRGVHYWWLEKVRYVRGCFDSECRAARKSARAQFAAMIARSGPLPPPIRHATIEEEVAWLAALGRSPDRAEFLGYGQGLRNPSARDGGERGSSPSTERKTAQPEGQET